MFPKFNKIERDDLRNYLISNSITCVILNNNILSYLFKNSTSTGPEFCPINF